METGQVPRRNHKTPTERWKPLWRGSHIDNCRPLLYDCSIVATENARLDVCGSPMKTRFGAGYTDRLSVSASELMPEDQEEDQ